MSFNAYVIFVNDIKAGQIFQSIRAAVTVGKSRRRRIAMTCLIYGKYHIASACEFNGEAILRFTRVYIAVYRQDAWGRSGDGGSPGYVKKGAHGKVIGAGKTNVFDLHVPQLV